MSVARRFALPLPLLIAGALSLPAVGQPVTGIWKGRVGNPLPAVGRSYAVEMKVVREGDSLRGVAYYRTLGRNHIRMSVSGYLNPYDGTVSWWHGARDGVDDRGRTVSDPLPPGMLFTTDYNCPDGTTLKLDGTAKVTTWSGRSWELPVHLQKTADGEYSDEWDRLIAVRLPDPEPKPPAVPPIAKIPVTPPPATRVEAPPSVKAPAPPPRPKADPPEKRPEPVIPPPPGSPEERFRSRGRTLVQEIDVAGDTLRLDFYDHAEVDGDSVSIFLGDRLLASHILLRATPHTLSIPVSDIDDGLELTMVAENLGTIPPNTSLLILYVDGVRHEARLESTERSSAMIRFRKPARRG